MTLKLKSQKLSFFDFSKHEKNQYDPSHDPAGRVAVGQYVFFRVRKFLVGISPMQFALLWDPTMVSKGSLSPSIKC